MNENLVAATECKTTLFLFPATIASGASPWLLHPSAKQPQALLDLCVDFCTHYFYLFAADKSHGRGQNSLPWLPQAQTLAVCRKPTIYPTCGRCCWLPTALSLSELRMRKEEAKPMDVATASAGSEDQKKNTLQERAAIKRLLLVVPLPSPCLLSIC